ncbi:hypothetical protein DFH09DRAFT_1364741 [Mycena vulgaris]|nr:hypothetical protein DFH09DRAFT_1364741 [Mycena vulgaris]
MPASSAQPKRASASSFALARTVLAPRRLRHSLAVLLPRLQLLDGDAPPDRSAEFIWLLGVAVPTRFHVAFYAQVWFTHRVGFEPIRDLPGLGALSAVGAPSPAQATPPPPICTPPPPLPPPIPTYSSSTATSTSTTLSDFTLPPSLGVGGTKGWTSDVGWGCMLRTGQSLFANRLPFPPPTTTRGSSRGYSIRAPGAPFGVHRMALAGEAAGKDFGMWFGPGAAASTIWMLVDTFPASGPGVSVATDGTLYQTEVYAASF